MKQKKTQHEAVISLFKKGKTLNWLTAFQLTGCSVLSRRIYDFKKMGYVFFKSRVTFITRYGTHGSYVDYTLNLKQTPKKLLK